MQPHGCAELVTTSVSFIRFFLANSTRQSSGPYYSVNEIIRGGGKKPKRRRLWAEFSTANQSPRNVNGRLTPIN